MSELSPKVIGYQVQDLDGNNWADRPSYEILTEKTAIADLLEAREQSPQQLFLMIAILDGDIEEPTYETSLLERFEDGYKTIAISSEVLSESEINILNELADDNMKLYVAHLCTVGFYYKLWEIEEDKSLIGKNPQFSDKLNSILLAAFDAGYQVVEFCENGVDPVHFENL